MVDVIEITIDEFKDAIYNKYVVLFPKEEQREWNKIEKTCKRGIEKMYKIVLDEKTIGFFMLEKINDFPFYLDYFAIYNEYQNKGYGTQAIERLITKYVNNAGIIGEIEKESKQDINTIKRYKFYEKLGFNKIESEYLLYGVLYTPIAYASHKKYSKDEYDKIFFEYYTVNCGNDAVKKNCKII